MLLSKRVFLASFGRSMAGGTGFSPSVETIASPRNNHGYVKDGLLHIELQGKSYVIPLNKKGQKRWSHLSDDYLLEFARAYCAEHNLISSIELRKADHLLHNAVNQRALIRLVFEKDQTLLESEGRSVNGIPYGVIKLWRIVNGGNDVPETQEILEVALHNWCRRNHRTEEEVRAAAEITPRNL